MLDLVLNPAATDGIDIVISPLTRNGFVLFVLFSGSWFL